MKVLKIQCDKCGKYIEFDECNETIYYTIVVSYVTNSLNTDRICRDLDYCSRECLLKFGTGQQ